MNSLPSPAPQPNEINAVKLLTYVESLADKKALTGALAIKNIALALIIKHDIARPLRIASTANEDVSNVFFTVLELNRYCEYNAKLAGLKIDIDGTVTTKAGCIMHIESSNTPTI